MKPAKALSVEEHKVGGRFEVLRSTLLGEKYAQHLQKPLAYWALPADRRLPLAFLGRTLAELLSTPYSELRATAGIGDKKMRSFIRLLARAAETDPEDLPAETDGPDAGAGPGAAGGAAPGEREFDYNAVSEVVWSNWRTSVVRHGLGGEKLGRLAPSVRAMTRVIWERPLEYYTQHTLAEIRAMKTHGEKRVRAVLEVFHAVHVLVAGMGVRDHLVVRIAPRRIDAVEGWVARVLQTPGAPTEAEIRERFVGPLLEQVRVDATPQIAELAETRLGLRGEIPSVRQMARQMGLTRARVYQLLNEINDILAVRWPTGRRQVYDLRARLQAETAGMEEPPSLDQFLAAIELFYPGGRRGAAGPLEAGPPVPEEDEGPPCPELDEAEPEPEAVAV